MTVTAVSTGTGPYRGLVPFEEGDERYFVGRENECDAIFDRLFACRLTIVYGASGVGKSSILRAGVVRRIREHEMSTPVVVTEWKGSATEEMDRVLGELGVDRRPDETLELRLRRAVATLQRYIMVILDQFEEVLSDTQRAEASDVQDLFNAIAALSTTDGGVSFVIALRADALADVDQLLRRVEDEFTPESYRVEPMSKADAERAIREPVERYNEDHGTNVTVETELVEGVLSGVAESGPPGPMRLALGGTESTDLPFLQIVMQRLWDEERSASPPSDTLSAQTLKRLGGTQRIMSEHVRRILGALSDRNQTVAAHLLGRLITPTGAKVAYSADDLAVLTHEDVADVQRVVDELSRGDSRLLRVVPGLAGRVYELFHDRLIGPVSTWREDQRAREIARQRTGDRRRIGAIAAACALLLGVAVGLLVAWLAADNGPPRAAISSVTIVGVEGLDTTKLYDGDDRSPLVIPVGQNHKFKFVVRFPETTDIIDVQVVPSTASDVATPGPIAAFINETLIQVPVGDVRPVGRGAYGRTDEVTLVIEASEIDTAFQVAELKFWKHGP